MSREHYMDKEDVFLESLTDKQAEDLFHMIENEETVRCLRIGLRRRYDYMKSPEYCPHPRHGRYDGI